MDWRPPVASLFRKHALIAIALCLALSACSGAKQDSLIPQPFVEERASQAVPAETFTPGPIAAGGVTVTPLPTPTSFPMSLPLGWQPIAHGISKTYLPVPTPGSPEPSYFYVLRIDPSEAMFKVIYDQNEPHLISEWRGFTDAPIILNGAFFTGQNTPNGRIITDGITYGSALDYGDDSIGVPGLFAVTGRRPEIFSLGRGESYNPRGLHFDQAVEAYPLLLLPGGQPTFPTDTHKRARRTVIGLDQQGWIVIVLSDIPLYSLYEMSEWLATSNLALDSALNLDGGRSTGMLVSLPDEEKLINSIVPVPIVIGIYPQP